MGCVRVVLVCGVVVVVAVEGLAYFFGIVIELLSGTASVAGVGRFLEDGYAYDA